MEGLFRRARIGSLGHVPSRGRAAPARPGRERPRLGVTAGGRDEAVADVVIGRVVWWVGARPAGPGRSVPAKSGPGRSVPAQSGLSRSVPAYSGPGRPSGECTPWNRGRELERGRRSP
jgi:hypothetical protein